MKIQKLNKELLNLYYKKDKKIYAQLVHDKVYVTDSYRIWILKCDDFMLDMNKLKTVDLVHFFNEDGYIPGIKTNKLVEMENGSVCVYLTSEENDFEVAINQKYLDVFENYTLRIKGETQPVLVYEGNEIVGLILPIRTH